MSCVLTLALDDDAQQRFEALRKQWLPPELNQIPAHLTIFHSLPETDNTTAILKTASRATAGFVLEVSSVRSIGRGVAIFLESREVMALQRQLSAAFLDVLSSQDRQGFRPHVVPWQCRAVGLDLWRYLGGPWQLLRRFAFSG